MEEYNSRYQQNKNVGKKRKAKSSPKMGAGTPKRGFKPFCNGMFFWKIPKTRCRFRVWGVRGEKAPKGKSVIAREDKCGIISEKNRKSKQIDKKVFSLNLKIKRGPNCDLRHYKDGNTFPGGGNNTKSTRYSSKMTILCKKGPKKGSKT